MPRYCSKKPFFPLRTASLPNFVIGVSGIVLLFFFFWKYECCMLNLKAHKLDKLKLDIKARNYSYLMHVSVFLEEPNLPLEQSLPVREPSKTCNERKNKLRQVSQIMWLLVNKLFVFHIFREINLKCKTKALSVGWDNTQNLLVSYLLHATWRYVLFFLKKVLI